ncbi:hypothetical protein PLICRDRAFT_242552 [Plicaturopsis crispa FD-325 SS-3]|nr:hypothetical protein PLICRDRAFT_242552 [Plicaturopsis crispa FD-325 SS-3]
MSSRLIPPLESNHSTHHHHGRPHHTSTRPLLPASFSRRYRQTSPEYDRLGIRAYPTGSDVDTASSSQLALPLGIRPPRAFLAWAFGRGTVVWRIWPAVLLHTTFAAVVVSLSLTTNFDLRIQPVLLTVLGVVIGFVISYRASSGYDRYWMGRSSWSDVVRNVRTFARLAWMHVPPRLESQHPENMTTEEREREAIKVMAEKRIALDLLEGFVVALKHHLRSEMGIYYEDLYHLIKPLHHHGKYHHHMSGDGEVECDGSSDSGSDHEGEDEGLDFGSPETVHAPLPSMHVNEEQVQTNNTGSSSNTGTNNTVSTSVNRGSSDIDTDTDTNTSNIFTNNATSGSYAFPDPIIPPINAYGTFTPPTRSRISLLHPSSSSSSLRDSPHAAPATTSRLGEPTSGTSTRASSHSSDARRPLLPSSFPLANTLRNRVARDLIPFASAFSATADAFRRLFGMARVESDADDVEAAPAIANGALGETGRQKGKGRSKSKSKETAAGKSKWLSALATAKLSHAKHRPTIAGGGENMPLEILRSLSEWLSVLEDRGTAGAALGGMFGCIQNLEDNLSTLERILTTPLPLVYSVHIRHTVWIYLFFLPFQLIEQFDWYAIPGVGIAAFIYLGFLAAGEEIEQPFGYDENDLDLDMFVREIVHTDIEVLKRTPCRNAWLPMKHAHGRVWVPETVDTQKPGEAHGGDGESHGRLSIADVVHHQSAHGGRRAPGAESAFGVLL